ncbi:enoyl-CoA hydratase/isomerase family protein [Bradyrhizobium genosp. L]|uniref:enoyl-CoA hydratase/isomerase family protein n=1 Tax=Bradyrhizobium genosp. L TaxID=83637 RepID=UPI0018A2F3EA|nr:enoyl-CoA hydratase/isomerase family protein [Bradyrhizobium genosp. L]QPF82150.1 enoyl-CoA hydratase/isomerase family protein [Bradyrhizobium genosp. L]
MDIVCSFQGEVGFVSIERPERRNALSLSLWRQLRVTLGDCAADPAVRCVILSGAGGHFCAGADISEFSRLRTSLDDALEYDRELGQCLDLAMRMSKPIIAAIEGNCFGGGVALACACDFRVAGRGARFAIPAARLGTLYPRVAMQALQSVVSAATCRRMLMLGGALTSSDALAAGLVDYVDDAPMLYAREIAGQLCRAAPLSLAGAKLGLCRRNQPGILDLDERLDRLAAQAFQSRDYAEGIDAFLNKRSPNFVGA